VKRGVTHVQPPAEILAQMITMRLHLDDCPAENGALRVIAGSHRSGLLARTQIQALTTGHAQTVTAKAGDAILMRPCCCMRRRPPKFRITAGYCTWNSPPQACFRPVWLGPRPSLAAPHAAAKGAA
jgi:hypothetical protein